jgi:hypothetical protein
VPRVPFDGRLRSSRQYCGPESWMPSALRVSRLGGASPRSSKLRGARRRGAQSRTTCPSQMDGSDLLGNTVGPSPGCPRHFASRSWEEAGPSIFKVAMGEEARSLIAHHVSLFDGRF